VVVGVALVPGPVMPSVVVGAAELVVGAGIIEDTSEDTTDTTLGKIDSTTGAAVDEGALADVVVAADVVVVAAAVEGVMTPLGPNVIAVSEDVVAAALEVSTVAGVVGVVVAG
jgi:hypothetical protein